jgi:hypothetical protein
MDDPPPVDDQHLVADRHDVAQVVAGQQDGGAELAGNPVQQVAHRVLEDEVEPDRRLVQEQDGGSRSRLAATSASIRWAARRRLRYGSMPPTTQRPDVEVITPVSILMVVDLPAPFAPMLATFAPPAISNDTSSTARTVR